MGRTVTNYKLDASKTARKTISIEKHLQVVQEHVVAHNELLTIIRRTKKVLVVPGGK